MERVSFGKIHSRRKILLKENESIDHVIFEGKKAVLISAPHGVNHVRLGREKYREVGSLAMAIELQKRTNAFMIAKTKNSGDDANFDPNCKYRKSIEKLVKKRQIKYLIDFHGLSAKRDCDINLGVHLGKNVESYPQALENLKNALVKNNFKLEIDKPFMGGSQTISGGMKNKFPSLWTLQVEINCAITNKVENFKKFERLLSVLENWIESLY